MRDTTLSLMNNTPGPSPQHTPASAPAPSPATVASRHAARSTAPKPGAEQRRARPRRAVRPSGEPDAAKPKPKPKPKPHPPARHERPAAPEAANQKPQQQADSSTDAADYPYVALTLQTTGIDIGLEDGMQELALFAGVVECDGVDSHDAPGGGMDAGGLQGERYVGVVGCIGGRVGLLRLLRLLVSRFRRGRPLVTGRWVRLRLRFWLGLCGVRFAGRPHRAARPSASLFCARFGCCGPGRVARSHRRGRRRWGRRRRVLRGGARCVVH